MNAYRILGAGILGMLSLAAHQTDLPKANSHLVRQTDLPKANQRPAMASDAETGYVQHREIRVKLSGTTYHIIVYNYNEGKEFIKREGCLPEPVPADSMSIGWYSDMREDHIIIDKGLNGTVDTSAGVPESDAQRVFEENVRKLSSYLQMTCPLQSRSASQPVQPHADNITSTGEYPALDFDLVSAPVGNEQKPFANEARELAALAITAANRADNNQCPNIYVYNPCK